MEVVEEVEATEVAAGLAAEDWREAAVGLAVLVAEARAAAARVEVGSGTTL